MAGTEAIATVSKTLRGLLEEARPAAFSEQPVVLLRPVDFDNGYKDVAGASKGAFGLLLHRVTINTARRSLPPRTAPDGTRLRPSLPVDLHYLLVVWHSDAEFSQMMLGWAMRQIEDAQLLPAHLLNHYAPVAGVFPENEGIEVVCDPLAIADWLALWDKLKPHLVIGMSYVARAVLLDSDAPLHSYGPVLERVLPLGEVAR
ncbi:DUF4255 domain-containing protein [Niveibacterium sp. 24ML]|uniref:DUF4255 domain-containing protein n=1 Tax=Niveibacterium sp. 24ML TaxID=2985512 RepID=UPI0022706B6E|nr:DUF4255 domain-containing protein [Niveibacterium sp. 24ML]MCX9158479.1 DUF4255 domain-containing protein [Niveibacterium sp. 24ML]